MMRTWKVLRSGQVLGAIPAFALLGALAVTPAFGATEVKNSEMVVTATRSERDLLTVPVSTSVVTRDEIEKKGYASVAQMLQDIPGVEVTDGSMAGMERVNIRGESSGRVLILVDGQKVSEQKSMSGAPILVPPGSIERIEVVKGPASVLYGAEAIGGVVNIITRKAGEKPVQGSADLLFNSSTDGWESNVSLFGKVKNVGYRFLGYGADHRDRRGPDGTISGTDYDKQAGSGYLSYEGDTFTAALRAEHSTSETDIPSHEFSFGSMDLFLPEWSQDKVSVFFDKEEISPSVRKFHFDAYVQNLEKDFEQRSDIRMGPMQILTAMDTANEQKTYGVNTQVDVVPLENHFVIAGYTYLRDDLDAETDKQKKVIGMPMMPPSGRNPHMGPPAQPTVPNPTFVDANIATHALYLQDEISLPQDLILTLGARQTWVESELEDTNDPKVKEKSVSDNHPVMSAGLVWNGMESFALRTSFAQGYRFPSLIQQFIGTSHGGAVTLGNPDLDPETSDNFEIGARFHNERWTVDVAAFAAKAEDYITTTKLNETMYEFDNVDKAETHGVEAYLSYAFSDLHLTPYLSGTFMRRKFEEKNFSTWDTRTPEFSGRLGMKYEMTLTRWPASVWVDGWVRAATDADDEDKNTGEIERCAAWQTLNLGLGGSFGKERQYQVSLNLNNILDQSYEMAQDRLEEAGFHAVMRMGVEF